MTIQDRLDRSPADIDLSEAEFARIAQVAKSGWGLNLESAKRPLIKSRLGRRLKALRLDSFDAYCDLLNAGTTDESDHFISALTTNVTHFFREKHHFDALRDRILPTLMERARKGERVRLWSAGCSTGQEPYSIAATVLELEPNAAHHDIRILATDVDKRVLQKAEEGIYVGTDCAFPSAKLEKAVFGNGKESACKVRQDLKALITFRHLNLMDRWPISGHFDVIMCRNVAIYFDRDTQNRLWSRFSDALVPGGHLFIGHSERIICPESAGLAPAGITTYQRPFGPTPSKINARGT